jgi:hypothetical protein
MEIKGKLMNNKIDKKILGGLVYDLLSQDKA